MTWTVRVETSGALTEDQQVALLDGGAFGVRAPNHDGTGPISIRFTVEAADASKALAAARRVLNRAGVPQLVTDGHLEQPHRIIVESPGAPPEEIDLVATKALAGILGVSEQRVRELTGKNRPDFPAAHTIEGAAGRYYRRSEAEEYAQRRRRAAGKP